MYVVVQHHQQIGCKKMYVAPTGYLYCCFLGGVECDRIVLPYYTVRLAFCFESGRARAEGTHPLKLENDSRED